MKTKILLSFLCIFISINISSQSTPFEFVIMGITIDPQTEHIYFFTSNRVGD